MFSPEENEFRRVKQSSPSSRVLKNYFGVRRLVAAFKSGQSEVQKPEENSSCVHGGDKSPHSKLAMRLSRAEFFSTLLVLLGSQCIEQSKPY